jgi:hypothetical protein
VAAVGFAGGADSGEISSTVASYHRVRDDEILGARWGVRDVSDVTSRTLGIHAPVDRIQRHYISTKPASFRISM